MALPFVSAWLRAAARALLAAPLCLLGNAALACSCDAPNPDEAFRRAGAVFVGRVIEWRWVFGWTGAVDTRVAVEQAIKDASGAEIVIRHETVSSACGVRFTAGERLTFFTERVTAGRTRTSLCSQLNAQRYASGRR